MCVCVCVSACINMSVKDRFCHLHSGGVDLPIPDTTRHIGWSVDAMLIYFHGGTLHPMRFYSLEPDNVSRGKPKNVPHVCDLHAWALLHPSHFDANFVTLLPSVSIESIGGH